MVMVISCLILDLFFTADLNLKHHMSCFLVFSEEEAPATVKFGKVFVNK